MYNNSLASEANNFVKFNSDNIDDTTSTTTNTDDNNNDTNINSEAITTNISDKNREMRFMNSNLNPNAAEFYPSYNGDQDYRFNQSYDVNKFSVDNDIDNLEVERLNGGLAIDCDKDQQNSTMCDYYGPAGNNSNSSNICGDYAFDSKTHYEPGYECLGTHSPGTAYNGTMNTAMSPIAYHENYVRNAPVYFNGYPNFGSTNMGCPLYYGPNMYLTQLGELFVPQTYGVNGMPYLHYTSGMMKCNEFYEPAENNQLGDYRKGVDPQLKILYQRPVPKKSKALEIKSPESLSIKKNDSLEKLHKELQKKQRQKQKQHEQLNANKSHIAEHIAKKSMSDQEMELSFNKPHDDCQHHPVAGLLLLPRNLVDHQNAKLSRMQGSLNLHVGSTATITDNTTSSGTGSGGSIKEKECLEGKSYILKHGSMRELKFEYEKFCSHTMGPCSFATATIKSAYNSSKDLERPRKRTDPLKVHFNLSNNETITNTTQPKGKVLDSRISAQKHAFELKHSNDLDNTGRTGYIKPSIKRPNSALKKTPAVAPAEPPTPSPPKQPVFSILCRKSNNNVETSPRQSYGSTAKSLMCLSDINESAEELDGDNAVGPSQNVQQINASIDERIKRVLSSNGSNKSEQRKDSEEMLKNINELELSESLIALSKKIAKSLDFNHDAIMQANLPDETDAKQSIKLNGTINNMEQQHQPIVIQHALNFDIPTSTAMLAKEPLDTKNSNLTLTSTTSGSSKSSLQPASTYMKRSQGKIFSSLPFLKSRQKSTVGYVDMKLNDVKKAKENERKREALKKLEAKQLVKKESLEKKQQAKALKAEEEKQKERQKEREKEKLKDKSKKSKDTEEKHKKTSSMASSVRRIFVPRFENKATANNTNEPVPPLKGLETKKISATITTRTGNSGTSLPSSKTSTLYMTKKPVCTARSPTTTSHLVNSKETIKVPLTSRTHITAPSSSSAGNGKTITTTAHINSETMGMTRTIFTRTTLNAPHASEKNTEKSIVAPNGVDAKSGGQQRTLRKVDHTFAPKITLTASNALKDSAVGLPVKNVPGDSATTAYVEELQKYFEANRKPEKSKTTCFITPPSVTIRKTGDLSKSHSVGEDIIGAGTGQHTARSHCTKAPTTGSMNYLCKKQDGNNAGSDAVGSFLSMNSIIKLVDGKKSQTSAGTTPASTNAAQRTNARENVVVQKIFKNCTCLSELRSGHSASNSTSTSPLNSSKLESSNVIQTPYSLTDFSTTNNNAQVNNSSNIPNSARIIKQQQQQQQQQTQQQQQQISPPTSSRNNKIPRDTVASHLRKIEIQKRQNLFPEDTNTNCPTENHQNIKMSQYLFK